MKDKANENYLESTNSNDEITKLREELIAEKQKAFKAVLDEFVEHKVMLAELEKKAKGCEEKIRRATKAKITRISNLEKAIQEFESKDESEITPEERAKYEKNKIEYDRKKNPQNYTAKKRKNRKSQAEILEETKKKIVEIRDILELDDTKVQLYVTGRSKEDRMINELNVRYIKNLNNDMDLDNMRSERTDSKIHEEKPNKEENKTEIEIKQENTDKEEKKKRTLREIPLNEIFNIEVQAEEEQTSHRTRTSNIMFEEDNKEKFDEIIKDAISDAEMQGFSRAELKRFILYRETKGGHDRVRKLERLETLIRTYKWDVEDLVDSLFDGNELEEDFERFEERHPRIARIPLIGRIIGKIADHRAQRKAERSLEISYYNNYVEKSKRSEFIDYIKEQANNSRPILSEQIGELKAREQEHESAKELEH